VGRLESNVTMTAEVVLFIKFGEQTGHDPCTKRRFISAFPAREHGGWELSGDGGLSTSVEAYMALKLLGVTETDQR